MAKSLSRRDHLCSLDPLALRCRMNWLCKSREPVLSSHHGQRLENVGFFHHQMQISLLASQRQTLRFARATRGTSPTASSARWGCCSRISPPETSAVDSVYRGLSRSRSTSNKWLRLTWWRAVMLIKWITLTALSSVEEMNIERSDLTCSLEEAADSLSTKWGELERMNQP